MDKSAFVGAVGSSIIHQGTQKESSPPMHWVRSIQTSVLAVDPEAACELAQPLLDTVWEPLENNDLDNHP